MSCRAAPDESGVNLILKIAVFPHATAVQASCQTPSALGDGITSIAVFETSVQSLTFE